MTRSLLAALVLLSCADIVQAGDSIGAVSVLQPLTRLVRQVEIEEACGVRGVAACTGFVGQRMDCECVESDTGWTIAARVQFIPVMFLSDATWAAHEHEHVADVVESVTTHVFLLEQLRFGTAEECRSEAGRQTAGFVSLMNRFKRASNAARHPGFARLANPR